MGLSRITKAVIVLAMSGLASAALAETGPDPTENEEELLGDGLAAELNETVVRVPVTVGLLSGRTRTGEMIVTHLRPPGPGPFPVVVFSHGSYSPANKVDRFRLKDRTRDYWIKRGFAIVAPTRLGYGLTGTNPFPEFSGKDCDNRNYGPMTVATSHQISVAVDFAKTLPWADKNRMILMGHSAGGLASAVATRLEMPGVLGAINSAGGYGGRSKSHPGQPCSPDRMREVYASAGAAARIPMLWIYSANDKLWGEQLPRQWHQAFTGSGGKADFVMGPPVGTNGHSQLDHFVAWRPHVDKFLAGLGFAVPSSGYPARPGKAASVDDAQKIPYLSATAKRDGYGAYLALDVPRAFVIEPGGGYAYHEGPNAVAQA
jgi:dienelactone hydrolase